jgi:hypothetical protein
MKNFTFLLLVATSLIYKVFADQIVVYGPPEGGIYHPKDIVDIRYKGR